MDLTDMLTTDANVEFAKTLSESTPRRWVVRESNPCIGAFGIPYMWSTYEDWDSEDAQILVGEHGLEIDVVALDSADAFALGFSLGEGNGTYILPLETAIYLSFLRIGKEIKDSSKKKKAAAK